MFKNNCYSVEACNYSFREDEDHHHKQNQQNLANHTRQDPIMVKLEAIQKMMIKQYQIQVQNKETLKNQADSISKIQKQIHRINRFLGINPQGISNSRVKSQSMKTCRTKRSTQKSGLACIQQRQKIINQELSRRISDQLDRKQQKKPLKFFMPSEQSIF